MLIGKFSKFEIFLDYQVSKIGNFFTLRAKKWAKKHFREFSKYKAFESPYKVDVYQKFDNFDQN